MFCHICCIYMIVYSQLYSIILQNCQYRKYLIHFPTTSLYTHLDNSNMSTDITHNDKYFGKKYGAV